MKIPQIIDCYDQLLQNIFFCAGVKGDAVNDKMEKNAEIRYR